MNANRCLVSSNVCIRRLIESIAAISLNVGILAAGADLDDATGEVERAAERLDS